MEKLTTFMTLIVTFIVVIKISVFYFTAKGRKVEKKPIYAEELIKYKGLTKKQYNNMMDKYYEEKRLKSINRQEKVIDISDYYANIEREYKALKGLYNSRNKSM